MYIKSKRAQQSISPEVIAHLLMKHIPSLVNYLTVQTRESRVKNPQVKWHDVLLSIQIDYLSKLTKFGSTPKAEESDDSCNTMLYPGHQYSRSNTIRMRDQ